MAGYPHYRAQFGDTTYTKVFVGGLAWETPTEEMRQYFQQFGDILEAVIITDKNTTKSKGYGFVTFRDPESARRACVDPNPVIDGRRANCNIASLGRPRPSTPRGRNQQGAVSYSGVPRPIIPPPPPPPLPPPHPVIYPPYGYPTYSPDYGYQQAVYNPQVQQPQYYHQMYGGSTSMGSHPYYYGYSFQSPPLRGAYNAVPYQPQRLLQPSTAAALSSYLYYPSPSQIEHAGSYPQTTTTTTTLPFQHITRYPFSSSATTDSSQPQEQHSSTELEGGITVTSESPDHRKESEG